MSNRVFRQGNQTLFLKKEGTNWRKKGGKHGELHAVIFVRRCVWFLEKLAISLKQYIV